LWPETVQAIRDALAIRPTPKDEADVDIVFVTKYGHRWTRTHGPKHVPIDAIALQFGKLLRDLGINGRNHFGFYSLRHTFRTVADNAKDTGAARLVMGHASDGTMDGVYIERIDDDRLVAVAEHVRTWLFGSAGKQNL
jgi:integrase